MHATVEPVGALGGEGTKDVAALVHPPEDQQKPLVKQSSRVMTRPRIGIIDVIGCDLTGAINGSFLEQRINLGPRRKQAGGI